MPRLSRQESQEHNREQVISAARWLFLRDGYKPTTVAAVADAAGFSTGVVYSNFGSKSELALQVLRSIQDQELRALSEVLARDEPREVLLDGIEAWALSAFTSGWPRLELEFSVEASSDPALMAAQEERLGEAIQLFTELFAPYIPPGPEAVVSPEEAAEVTIDLVFGIWVRHMVVDPDLTYEVGVKMMRHLIEIFVMTPNG